VRIKGEGWECRDESKRGGGGKKGTRRAHEFFWATSPKRGTQARKGGDGT